MKDEKGLIIRRDKMIYIGKGRFKEVPYAQWKKTVVNNPLGETARRALEEGDKDLEELTIDNIQIQSNEEVEQPKVNEQNFPIISKDNSEELKIKQMKRRGFISTEKSVE